MPSGEPIQFQQLGPLALTKYLPETWTLFLLEISSNLQNAISLAQFAHALSLCNSTLFAIITKAQVTPFRRSNQNLFILFCVFQQGTKFLKFVKNISNYNKIFENSMLKLYQIQQLGLFKNE